MARGRGDVLLWEGVVAVMGVLVVWVEMACVAFLWIPASAGMTWRGYCGEFRASPCSLRSRPPSRGEGG